MEMNNRYVGKHLIVFTEGIKRKMKWIMNNMYVGKQTVDSNEGLSVK